MRRSTILFALAIVILVFGSTSSMAQLNLAWEEVGPNNTGNHARALAVGSGGKVWAGSVGGGLWTSTDGGSSWTQVTGLSDNLAVSCIALEGNNIYVGTGEMFYNRPETNSIGTWTEDSLTTTVKNGYLRYASRPGEGVFVSNDGGVTWDHDNGTWNSGSVRYQGDFISIQEVATKGGRTLVGTLNGLYWSDDADLTNITKSTGTTAFMNEVITDVDFANNGVVYAATDDSLYRSTDNGISFGAAINSTIPYGTQAPNNRLGGHRIELAVAPSNADIMYVTGANDITGNCTGVWRSTDNGFTWVSISPYESATFKPFQNKGLYAMTLAVPANDPMVVFIGGTKMYKFSVTAGWEDAASHTYVGGFSTRYVPAPQHIIAFDGSADSTLYVAGDHEIVKSENWGDTYAFRTKGFNNAQLHGISASPSFKLLASDRYHGVSYKDNGLSSQNLQQFNSIYSATLSNGGIARWSNIKPEYFVVTKAEDRGLQRSLTQGATFEDFYGFPIDSVNPCWGLNPDSMIIDRATTSVGGGGVYDRSTAPIMPFCFDEYIPADSMGNDTSILNTPQYLFMASGNFIWVCLNPFGPIDSVPNWNRVSDDMNPATPALPFGKKRYYSAIAASNDADHYLYVGTNNGEIYRLHGAHDPQSFCVTTDAARIDGGTLPQRWITDIEVDPSNPNNIIVTFGGYAAGDDRVYISNDARAAVPTFRSIQSNLEANLPVYSAAFHPDASQKCILIGTEEGIYGTNSNYESGGAVSWSNESGSLIGTVPVMDIVFRRWYMEYSDVSNYHYSPDNTVFIATLGRGAFKTSSLVTVKEKEIGSSGIKLKAVPNPAVASTSITFDLPQATHVKLEAFGIDGRPVAQLTDSQFGAGHSEVEFDTHTLPAGVYLVTAQFQNSKGVYLSNLRVVVVK